MFMGLLFIIYHRLLLTYVGVRAVETNIKDLDWEDFFKEDPCIPEPSEDFFSNILENGIKSQTITTNAKDSRNYRSEVNVLVQFNKLDFHYNIVSEEGPIHEKIFNVLLQLGDETFHGSGKSKKEAKEMAAKQAIENTSYQKPSIKMKDRDIIDENSPPTVILNNLGLRHGYEIHYYMVDPMLNKRMINLKLLKQKSLFTNSSFWKEAANLDEPPKSPFHVEVDVNGQSFYAKAHSIQTAKHEAAVKAVEYLKQKGFDKNSVCTMKGYENECAQAKAKLKSPISILYEYAQNMRLSLEFKELDRVGPAHKPIFEMGCTLGSETVIAKGKSKKEAKRIAAQMMLEKIPELDLTTTDFDIDQSGTKKLKRKKKSRPFLESSKDILGNVISFFSSGDEKNIDGDLAVPGEKDNNKISKKKKKKQSKDGWSPMEKLSDSAKDLNLKIEFHSLPREKSGFYSILSIGLNPKHICLGIGSNVEISQEYAALNALKFLHKIDVLEGVDEDQLRIERFSFDNYIWLAKEHSEKI